MRFAFIRAEKDNFPVAAMCRLLGVTRQGFYAYMKRPPSRRVVAQAKLRKEVRNVFERSKGRYGSPRVHAQLQREGISASKRGVEQTMRAEGLCARPLRRFRFTTCSDPSHGVEANALNREFCAAAPNERWVTDITYVWTDEGWYYLAVILDLFSRGVVGWALSESLGVSLPLAALRAAVTRYQPQPGLLHHSDRGSQYTSAEYRGALAELGVRVSMSRKGNCWDNAVAESFFSTLKTELLHGQAWPNGLVLRAALFEYIEIFYNRQRLHSSLGYKTPAEVEDQYAAQAA